jgi:hypothetical protein
MTRIGMGIALLLGLLLYGCGRSNYELLETTTVTPGDGPTFSLRLAGEDAGDFISARMQIQSVQVTGGGALLANAVKTPEMDLAETGHAHLLATFQVPAGVDDVDFVVAFAGGTLTTSKGSVGIDARCQTLRLTGKVSRIAERRHAVIHLDVARSFVPGEVGLMLVPHFRLLY